MSVFENAPPASGSGSRPAVGQSTGNVHLFTRDEYHRMLDAGVLGDPSSVELLDGMLVDKMTKHGPHCVALELLREEIRNVLPEGWIVRTQDPIITDLGEPEPDAAVVKGTVRDYRADHPRPDQVALVVEVSESTLDLDRGMKATIYARNGIPEYWIVNLADRRIEVHTNPSGPGESPLYHANIIYTSGQSIPVMLDDRKIGEIVVEDVLP